MSKIAQFQTTLRDGQHLVAALEQLGYTVEQFATPQPINIYGDTSQRAEIIVRKSNLESVWVAQNRGAYCHLYGDLGFTMTADGTYRCIHDDMDETYVANPKWMEGVNNAYAEHESITWAVSNGYVFQGRTQEETASGVEVSLLFGVRD